MHSPIPIFDGHNDVLLRLFNKRCADVEQLFLNGENDGQLDFPRAILGGFAGGMFAIFVSSKDEPDVNELMRGENYDIPLPEVISARAAVPSALAMAAILFRIEKRSGRRASAEE
jgi:membrane dipeptidase